MSHIISRRNLLKGTAVGFRAGFIHTASHAFQLPGFFDIPDRANVPEKLPGPVGERSPYEKSGRYVYKGELSGWTMTPLEKTYGIITPSDLNFERHHAGIPDINPETYELLIHGMVDKPLKFTLNDLKRFPSQSVICFIECSGNGAEGYL